MKFSALNADFSNPSANHLHVGSGTPAQVGVKRVYPLKVDILPALARIA